jgi:pyridoxamine 5'-phosphate oxidase-like protein
VTNEPSAPAASLPPPPRSRAERIRDTLRRFENDIDLWVATADGLGGAAHLVPLSFLWDGETLLIATPGASPTGRNLQATGAARLGVGHTRDVVLVEATAETITQAELSAEMGDAFASKTGFDPRQLSEPYLYFRLLPMRIRAWREVDELAGRDLMREGRWLDG